MLTLTPRVIYPSTDLRPQSRSRARFLLNTYYSAKYGESIRYESCRSMRLKIHQVRLSMTRYRKTNPTMYQCMARTLLDYERICAFHEMLERPF
jgi:hypothetical protein